MGGFLIGFVAGGIAILAISAIGDFDRRDSCKRKYQSLSCMEVWVPLQIKQD